MRTLYILWTYLRVKYCARFKTREDLLAWQHKRILSHLRFLRRKSPYFRSLPAADLQSLPIMDKAVMMTHFNELNTVGIEKEKAFKIALAAESSRDFNDTLSGITIGLSSGTSGNRGLFCVSPHEIAMWTGQILARALPGSLLGRHRIALFLRANSKLYESTSRSSISFRFFDMLANMDGHVAALHAMSPTVLVAPPSILRILAQRQKDGSLAISPQRIYAAAEVLEPQDATFIKESFGLAIDQIYQATEGFLGISCSAHSLHLNEDIVFVEKEFLDQERSRFVPIITDFRRKTQPIVRYRLNDILTLDPEPCSCGSVFTRLKAIEGRSDDLIRLQDMQDPHSFKDVFPDFLRRSVISASDAIREYRVRQTAPDLLAIELDVEMAARSACELQICENIAEICREFGVVTPRIAFADYVPPLPGVKLRRIVRELPLDSRHSPTRTSRV